MDQLVFLTQLRSACFLPGRNVLEVIKGVLGECITTATIRRTKIDPHNVGVAIVIEWL